MPKTGRSLILCICVSCDQSGISDIILAWGLTDIRAGDNCLLVQQSMDFNTILSNISSAYSDSITMSS